MILKLIMVGFLQVAFANQKDDQLIIDNLEFFENLELMESDVNLDDDDKKNDKQIEPKKEENNHE